MEVEDAKGTIGDNDMEKNSSYSTFAAVSPTSETPTTQCCPHLEESIRVVDDAEHNEAVGVSVPAAKKAEVIPEPSCLEDISQHDLPCLEFDPVQAAEASSPIRTCDPVEDISNVPGDEKIEKDEPTTGRCVSKEEELSTVTLVTAIANEFTPSCSSAHDHDINKRDPSTIAIDSIPVLKKGSPTCTNNLMTADDVETESVSENVSKVEPVSKSLDESPPTVSEIDRVTKKGISSTCTVVVIDSVRDNKDASPACTFDLLDDIGMAIVTENVNEVESRSVPADHSPVLPKRNLIPESKSLDNMADDPAVARTAPLPSPVAVGSFNDSTNPVVDGNPLDSDHLDLHEPVADVVTVKDAAMFCNSSNDEDECENGFINRGLALWESKRQGWLLRDASSSESSRAFATPLDVDEIIDIIFTSPKQIREEGGPRCFPQPVALPQMIDILVDLWEAEGLDI